MSFQVSLKRHQKPVVFKYIVSSYCHLPFSLFLIYIYICIFIYMCVYTYIYVIMKIMCPPGYHHNGFVATHALIVASSRYCNYAQ